MSARPSFSIWLDVTNPGQFFACCGLLELADRLWPGAEGWFEDGSFAIVLPATANSEQPLGELLQSLNDCPLDSDDPEADPKTCPLRLHGPFNLRLDWWLDDEGGAALKTWAGQQSVTRIAVAMKHATSRQATDTKLLETGMVVRDPTDQKTPVEPFYFDARRFSHALTTGFSLDVQNAETLAHPAVEFLCLVGLQRVRPRLSDQKWCFEYHTWLHPLPSNAVAAVASGCVLGGSLYQFRLSFRDNQKRYKAFSFAVPRMEMNYD